MTQVLGSNSSSRGSRPRCAVARACNWALLTLCRTAMASATASVSMVGAPDSTTWPRPSRTVPVRSTAARTSGSVAAPGNGDAVAMRMRWAAGACVIACRKGTFGAVAVYGSPGAVPATASSSAALSRTVRVRACSLTKPSSPWPAPGAKEVRPRRGLRPTSPQQDAGTRIDPVPSPPDAAGTTPAATAAADPPLDPPGGVHGGPGFTVGPNSDGSGGQWVP